MSGTKCPGCGLVYDLSSYRPGLRCRCRCGQLLIASEPESAPMAKMARTIHCSACGGNLEKGRSDCPYCNAVVDLTDARMVLYCAACLSMNKEGARFCSDCGTAFSTRVEAPDATSAPCPRCRSRLRRRSLGGHRPLECPMCCGLFVADGDLDALLSAQKDTGESSAATGRGPERASIADLEVRYVKCPICSVTMNRVNFGGISGVIVDSCKAHGHWLDPGELEKIARWIASGGLAAARKRELEAWREERSRRAEATQALAAVSLTAKDDDGDSSFETFVRVWGVLEVIASLLGKD